MSKVKLTIDQSRMINNHRSHFESLMNKRNNKNTPTTLDDVSVEDVVKAFFNGYEVVTEFKEGEWVITERGNVGILYRVEDDYTYTFRSSTGTGIVDSNSDNIRHATLEEIEIEKQRIWWGKHGRKVGEFKLNDLVTPKRSKEVLCIIKISNGRYLLSNSKGSVHRDGVEMVIHHKVVCFVEDRKDLEY